MGIVALLFLGGCGLSEVEEVRTWGEYRISGGSAESLQSFGEKVVNMGQRSSECAGMGVS